MRKLLPLVVLAAMLPVEDTPGKPRENRQLPIPYPSDWTVIGAEYAGQPVQEAHVSFTYTRMTKNRFWVCVQVRNEMVVHHVWAEYQLNTAVSPAELDFRDRKGIYTFDGEYLMICSAGPGMARPKGFRTSRGDNTVLLVLKRKWENVQR